MAIEERVRLRFHLVREMKRPHAIAFAQIDLVV